MGFKALISNAHKAIEGAIEDSIAKKAAGKISFNLRIASFLFSRSRPFYYNYLADMIESTQGKKSLREIFASDVVRYDGSARGVLAKHWMARFEDGGYLDRTFTGTVPNEDVALLGALQKMGGAGALESGLRDMGSNAALISKARSIIVTTSMASMFCLAMVLALTIAMPIYTLPKIMGAFSLLPPDAYPANAAKLFAFGSFISSYWPACVIVLASIAALIFFSLSTVTGGLRKFLERYGVLWGIYRDFQGLRFISSLAIMVKRRGNSSVGLRSAIGMQLAGASRWKTYHLRRMLESIDNGQSDESVFGTGIIDNEMYWYICDLIASRGLDDALQFIKTRLEEKVIKTITSQSVVLSWAIMLLSLAGAGYLMFWHISAIDDMVSALKTYLS